MRGLVLTLCSKHLSPASPCSPTRYYFLCSQDILSYLPQANTPCTLETVFWGLSAETPICKSPRIEIPTQMWLFGHSTRGKYFYSSFLWSIRAALPWWEWHARKRWSETFIRSGHSLFVQTFCLSHSLAEGLPVSGLACKKRESGHMILTSKKLIKKKRIKSKILLRSVTEVKSQWKLLHKLERLTS